MKVKIDRVDIHMKVEQAEALIAISLLDMTGTISFSGRIPENYYSVNKIGPPEHNTYELWEYKKRDIKYVGRIIATYSRKEIYEALVTGEFY